MLQLIMLMMLVQAPGPGTAERMLQHDRLQGPTPVTSMFLLPPKLKDCRTEAEVRAALDARRYGEREPCDPDPMLRRAR